MDTTLWLDRSLREVFCWCPGVEKHTGDYHGNQQVYIIRMTQQINVEVHRYLTPEAVSSILDSDSQENISGCHSNIQKNKNKNKK